MASFHTCWLLGWSGCSSSTKELHGMAIWMHIWNYLGGGYFPLCDLSSIFVLILILVAVIGLSMLVDPHPGLRHAVLSTVHSTVFDYIHCFKAHSHNVHFTLSGAADVCTAAKKIEKVLIFSRNCVPQLHVDSQQICGSLNEPLQGFYFIKFILSTKALASKWERKSSE